MYTPNSPAYFDGGFSRVPARPGPPPSVPSQHSTSSEVEIDEIVLVDEARHSSKATAAIDDESGQLRITVEFSLPSEWRRVPSPEG